MGPAKGSEEGIISLRVMLTKCLDDGCRRWNIDIHLFTDQTFLITYYVLYTKLMNGSI